MKEPWSFDTQLIHGCRESGPAGATTVPIIQASAFAYATAEELEDVFRGRRAGQVYTRLGNPTTETLERRLGACAAPMNSFLLCSGLERRWPCVWNATAPMPCASPNFSTPTPWCAGSTIRG